MLPAVNIIEAIRDPKLFRPFLANANDSLHTWAGWLTILKAIYGIKISNQKSVEFFRHATGRDPSKLPSDGFDQFLGLIGRRSGKSRITSVIAAYEAALGRRWEYCQAGETPYVAIISPQKQNSKAIKRYIRAIFDAPMLKGYIVDEQSDGFTLKNRVEIRILSGDVAIRGTTCICVCLDEVCMHGSEEDARLKTDTELVRACEPTLMTTGGKLLAISTPKARRGWAFEEYERAFANDEADDILVVNGWSRTFNQTLKQKVVDRALKRDYQGAKAEYLGEFRDSVAAFIGRDLVEACVVKNHKEFMPKTERRYFATVDMSAGKHDAAALCVGHLKGDTLVVDLLHHYPSPHEPYAVVKRMADTCKRYRVRHVTGDRYAGNWVSDAWRDNGIKYQPSELSSSEAYAELMPRFTTPGALQLPELEVLIKELCNLEIRVRPNGADLITHPPGRGHHDDAAVVVALLATVTKKKVHRVGGLDDCREYSY